MKRRLCLRDIPRRKWLEDQLRSYNDAKKTVVWKQHVAASSNFGSLKEGIRQKHMHGDRTWSAVLRLEGDEEYQQARQVVELVESLRDILPRHDWEILFQVYIEHGPRKTRLPVVAYFLGYSTRGLRYRRAQVLRRVWTMAKVVGLAG